MNRNALIAILLVALGALMTGTSPASAEDEVSVRVVALEDVEYPAMTAVISVEVGGRPLPSLDAGSLVVTDNGSPVTVTRVSRLRDENIPTSVVVTMDTSGSMSGAKLASAKEALSGLVLRLSRTDSVALVRFADKAQLVIPSTADKSLLAGAVSGLEAGGNTALYAAVAESGQISSAASAPRRLVVLLTDGEEFGNVSGISREESLARAVQSGAIYYVIGLGAGADRSYLTELASRTGGRYLDAPAPADLVAGYAAIEETLKGQFVLSLESMAPGLPLTRAITVKVSSAAGTGTAEYSFKSTRPQPAPTPGPTSMSVSALPPAVQPRAPATATGDSSGNRTLVLLSPVAAVLLLAAAGATIWRRRTRPEASLPQPIDGPPPADIPSSTPGPEARPVAHLIPRPGQESAVPLASLILPREPVTLGWSPECRIHLPQIDGIAPVHARLWWKDGTVILHHLGGGTTAVNGAPAKWASLSDGDSVSFGPYLYRYSKDLAPIHRKP